MNLPTDIITEIFNRCHFREQIIIKNYILPHLDSIKIRRVPKESVRLINNDNIKQLPDLYELTSPYIYNLGCLRYLRILNIDYKEPLFHHCVRLPQLDHLEELSCRYNMGVSDISFMHLTNLRKLKLAGQHKIISGKAIRKLINLQELYIWGFETITNDMVDAILSLKKLTYLSERPGVYRQDGLTDEDIKKMTGLRKLDVAYGVHGGGLLGLTNLTALGLYSNHHITEDFLSKLTWIQTVTIN